MPKKLSITDLRAIRTAAATLKRKGLLPASLDARSVQPTKSLKATIRKFKDVLNNDASVIRASRVVRLSKEDLARLGVRTSRAPGQKQRLIVTKETPEDKVTTVRHQIALKNPRYTKVKLPNGIDQFKISDLDPKLLPTPKRDEYFSFKNFGFKTERIFRTPELMMEYLNNRQSGAHYEDLTHDEQETFIQHLQIYRFHRTKEWEQVPNHPRKEKHKKQRKDSKTVARKKRKSRWDRTPQWKKNDILEKKRKEAKEYRAKIKSQGGAKYEEYKRKAAQRAKKAR